MTVFEVGDLVHILANGPIDEEVEVAGAVYSEWPKPVNDCITPSDYHYYQGMVGIIKQAWNAEEDNRYGGRYRVNFPEIGEAECELDFYGQDFEEFYDSFSKFEVSQEDIMELLG